MCANYLKRQQQLIEHLQELQLSYGFLEEGDITRFESIATNADYEYIDKLTSACTKWIIQGTEKDQARLERDEIKCLKRVEDRLKKSVDKNMRVVKSESLPGRFVIVDNDNKVVDDAQGYGYKSFTNAKKAMWYKYSGGKEKLDKDKQEQKDFIRKHPGLDSYIISLYENNFKDFLCGLSTDADVIAAVKEKFGIDMPIKYLKYFK